MAKKLINLAKIDFAGNAEAGPAPAPSADADVVLRDYDGSVVASYTKEEFAALTELPTPPEHEGLTFQEWNWSLVGAQKYCASYGKVDIGAIYITSDGKTRIYISLPEGRISPYLGMAINGSVDVDWGDNSAHDIVTSNQPTRVVSTLHNYSAPGDYIITLTPMENTSLTIYGNTNPRSQLLWSNNNSSNSPNQAYQACIQKVLIGRGVNLGYMAFTVCSGLKYITIPRDCTLGQQAFNGCHNLINLNIPSSITQLPSTFTSVCYNLQHISLPETLNFIGGSSFTNTRNLHRITLPESITSISPNTFENGGLRSITIPKNVTNINNNAFAYCYDLAEINIPEGVTTIGANAFQSCFGLSSIRIPESVTTIGDNAFQSCSSLRSINIPQGITAIPNNFIAGAYGIEEIRIPESVTTIGTTAFQNCGSLRSINIPQGITTLSNSIFAGCGRLTAMDIPDNVTSIGVSAFGSCYSMAIYRLYPTTPPTIQSNTFSSIPADAIIYVPAESVDAYKAATNWSAQASKIQPMP